jgi:hypothetical protein
MPNLCCVAQKAASAAQLRFKNNFLTFEHVRYASKIISCAAEAAFWLHSRD